MTMINYLYASFKYHCFRSRIQYDQNTIDTFDAIINSHLHVLVYIVVGGDWQPY